MHTHNHVGHRHQCVAALLFAVLTSLGLLSPLPLAAQDTVLEPGDRIRVRPFEKPRRGPRRITGRLVSIEADTLRFDRRGETLQYSLTEIKMLEAATGEKNHTAGTLIGIVGGGVLGLGLGSGIEQLLSDSCTDFCGVGGAIVGFGVGVVVGGVVGYYLLADEQWTPVSAEGLSVSFGPGAFVMRLSL